VTSEGAHGLPSGDFEIDSAADQLARGSVKSASVPRIETAESRLEFVDSDSQEK
jgi:hypothetical protein